MREMVLMALVGLLSGGCDAAGNSTLVDGGSASFYAGAGSEWSARLNTDSTFRLLHFPLLTQKTADQLIDGIYTTTPAGFVSLSVTDSAGTGQPIAGAQGYAIEIPQSLFLLSPFSANSSSIPMLPAGGCPGGMVNDNLVIVKAASTWSAASGDVSATLSFDPASGVVSLPSRSGLGGAALGPLAMGSGSCGDGMMTTNDGTELFLSAGGSAIVHVQPGAESTMGDEVYLGLPRTGNAVTAASLAGSYVGLLFANDAAPTNLPVHLVLSADGDGVSGAATQIVDVTLGTPGTLGARIALTALGAVNGFVTGTIDDSGPGGGGVAQPLTCAVQPAAGVIACAGASQAGQLVSLIVVSRAS